MFIDIITHTPFWVWIALAALVAIGIAQSKPRTMSRTRAAIRPVLFALLSLVGVIQAFGASPAALLAWIAGAALAATVLRSAVAVRGAEWRPSTGQVSVPGSWIPMMLILGLFLTKYLVGVCLALHREWAADAGFSVAASLAYGVFAGLLWARGRSVLTVGRAAERWQPV
jgi:hypothetical protein